MNINLLDSAADIREAFVNRFVLSWEEFRITKKDWIAKTSANYPITKNGTSKPICGTKCIRISPVYLWKQL